MGKQLNCLLCYGEVTVALCVYSRKLARVALPTVFTHAASGGEARVGSRFFSTGASSGAVAVRTAVDIRTDSLRVAAAAKQLQERRHRQLVGTGRFQPFILRHLTPFSTKTETKTETKR